ncbi:hypothetical protein [Frigoriglobus tundricola]|uniref:Uncharacterized protein n=1 Tax=Frigoriglobus tundricola TaxID=2774151 RepID=A0A6M5YSF3_9BACT|nr:hypothetical protein [Frigoriglobus tundricola]QJW96354.1 hypothetical protein FTUN_3911 [Frigoriglobus tundricola]
MSWSIAVVCEAPADRETAVALATRAVCEHESVREWMEPEYLHFRGYRPDDPHLLWREVKATAVANRVSVVGFINGLPASPDAHNALRALNLFNRLDPRPDAVVLVRDSDGDLSRRTGLQQARDAEPWPFPVVVGLAHTKRECWHIAGFEPKDGDEHERLENERRHLGFDPRKQSHELTAKHDEKNDKRSAKRVLTVLTADDLIREAECLAVIVILLERGEENGLRAFLQEIATLLLPLFTR